VAIPPAVNRMQQTMLLPYSDLMHISQCWGNIPHTFLQHMLRTFFGYEARVYNTQAYGNFNPGTADQGALPARSWIP